MRRLRSGGKSKIGGAQRRPHIRWVNALVALILVGGLQMLFPPVKPATRFDYKVGDVTQKGEEIIAPIAFPVPVNPERLSEQRASASLAVDPVYRVDPSIARQLGAKLDKLSADLAEIRSLDTLATRAPDSLSMPQIDALSLRRGQTDRLLGLYPGLERASIDLLFAREGEMPILATVKSLVDTLLARGVLDTSRPLGEGRRRRERITLLEAGREREAATAAMVDQEDLNDILDRETRRLHGWNEESRKAAGSLSRAHLRPNYFYDAGETESRKQAAEGAVPDQDIIARGVRILDANVQVTQYHLDRLLALEAAMGLQSITPLRMFALYAGRTLLLAFILLLAVRCLLLYRRDFFDDHREVLLLGILLLLFLAVSKFVLPIEAGGPYLLPIAFVAMIVAGLHDIVLAMITTVLALLLLGAVASPPPGAILVALLAGGTSAFSIRQLRDRLQLYKSILYIALSYVVGIVAIHMVAGTFDGLVGDGLAGMGNGLLCAWLVMPVLPLLERVFDLTTDFTLLELTDLNRPILKRMKIEAPGTFQHSLVVSNLAEAAVDAIDGNPLLAKVCAYYHDIGKLEKPDYFAENQQRSKNPHDKLKPNMSSLIISAHVREGLELAERIKLPSIVRRAIPEHHGTTVMSYFHHRAMEQDPHGQVKADDFRYPGPKPQSAETAVLMLADTVEATARALPTPSPGNIRSVVSEAIRKRLDEGELEECGLSIRDLARIRDSFVTTLLSIHHPRIQYPGGITADHPARASRKEPQAAENEAGGDQDATASSSESDVSRTL